MNPKVTRRNFMRHSTQGAVAMAALPHFLTSKDGHAAGAGEKLMTLDDYLDHFGVTRQDIDAVMSEALSRGGDYCDIYFQHKISNYIGLEDNAVNRAYTDVDFGVGIRVLSGDQTGYSFTEEITLKAMKLAAQTAANIARDNKKVDPVELTLKETPNYYKIQMPWEDVSIDQKIPPLQQINDKIYDLDNRIIKSSLGSMNETSYMVLATSDGRIVYDYQPMALIYVSCVAEQNGKKEQNGFNLAGRNGFEFVTDENINRLAKESVSRTVELFDAVKPKAGELPVVMAAGSSGILLHEAIGHGMEADFNRKEVSIFSDKIGKKVAEPFVTIVDNGTNPNVRGSINVDDEGNDSQETVLVENGILTSYLHDRISAKHYGVEPTGSGRRQDFRNTPMPRMRNTYMLNGPHTKDEIISSVDKGIYAETFSNGQVFIGAGDFTFYVKTGYLIENGKLTQPIKDINIIGNGPEVLSKIVMAGDDFKMAEGGWTCGKNGQGVPVSQGLPTVKVSSITVGGVNS